MVTRPESPPEEGFHNTSHDRPPVEVRTDYLTITAPIPEGAWDARESLRQAVKAAVGSAWGEWQDRQHGYMGYERCATWERGGAYAAWGGQKNTVMLTMPGKACELVSDWPLFVLTFRDGFGARITRWDGAADDKDGRHTVDDAADEWLAGGFNLSGRPPSASQAGNWLRPDGAGRTFYVGKRASGKMARVYEKGKQLKCPRSPWVRWEIELHRVDREIPWEAVIDPRPFIAGSYPAFAWIAAEGVVARVPTFRERAKMTMDHLVYHARRAYGQLVATMESMGATAEGIVETLRRAGTPKRLEHDEYLRQRSLTPAGVTDPPGWVRALMNDWILTAGGAWVPDVEAPYWWEHLLEEPQLALPQQLRSE